VTPADADAAAHVYIEAGDALPDHCVVDGADGHHLARVRRLRAGERVTVADGVGTWRVYEIVDVVGDRLTLEARGDLEREVAPAVGVALAVALTKGGIESVVSACTELGVARVTPVRAARSVVRWDAAKADAAVEKLRRAARDAGMQSRRARVPQIDAVCDIAEVARRPDLVVADRTGVRAAHLPRPASAEWTVLVGPEGGLARDELATLGPVPRLRLGPHVLRAATAPIAAVAVLVAEVPNG
jgi:16S rRNA (uracil1498-N3)-methyltransferase